MLSLEHSWSQTEQEAPFCPTHMCHCCSSRGDGSTHQKAKCAGAATARGGDSRLERLANTPAKTTPPQKLQSSSLQIAANPLTGPRGNKLNGALWAGRVCTRAGDKQWWCSSGGEADSYPPPWRAHPYSITWKNHLFPIYLPCKAGPVIRNCRRCPHSLHFSGEELGWFWRKSQHSRLNQHTASGWLQTCWTVPVWP